MFRGIALLILVFTSFTIHAAVVTEEIMYKVAGKEFTGYMAYDNDIKGKRPGVLVLHEWWGHDDYARKRAEMLAGLGYTAFALDMYGAGKKADHPKDAKAMMMEVFGNMPEAKKRFQTAKQLLMDH